jgi:hypothetical protein
MMNYFFRIFIVHLNFLYPFHTYISFLPFSFKSGLDYIFILQMAQF